MDTYLPLSLEMLPASVLAFKAYNTSNVADLQKVIELAKNSVPMPNMIGID